MIFSMDTDIPLLSGDCSLASKAFHIRMFTLSAPLKQTLRRCWSYYPRWLKYKNGGCWVPNLSRYIWSSAMSIDDGNSWVWRLHQWFKSCGITTLSKHISSCNNTEEKLKDESVLFQHLLQIMKKAFKSCLIDEIVEVYWKESENFADIEA